MPDQKWKRPESFPFPKVWRRFYGKKPLPNGKIPKFRIQDVTEDLEDVVVEHMLTGFLRDSPLGTCMKVWEEPETMSDFAAVYRKSIKQRISLVALLDDEEKSKPVVVGAHILAVQSKEEKDFDFSQYQGRILKKLFAGVQGITGLVDVYDKYGVDKAVTEKGLSVARDFRGQGVALELLKAKTDLMKAIGVKIAPMVCTALQSQILAERVGYELLVDIPYKEHKIDGEIVFNVTNVPNIKYYVQEIR